MLSMFWLLCLTIESHSSAEIIPDPVEHQNWPLLDDKNCGVITTPWIHNGSRGESALSAEFPWLVSLQYSRSDEMSDKFRCTGVILNAETVLTAAHCVTGLPEGLKLDQILFGDWTRANDSDCTHDICQHSMDSIAPKEVLFHEGYDASSSQNDIALIRLAEDVRFTSYVRPICMMRGSLMMKSFFGNEVETAGWGINSMTLLKLKLKVLEDLHCKDTYPEIDRDIQMCVGGEPGKSPCVGDLGGPLMFVAAENGPPRVFTIGIASVIESHCGETTIPALYTRLSYYVEWILDNLIKNKVNFKIA